MATAETQRRAANRSANRFQTQASGLRERIAQQKSVLADMLRIPGAGGIKLAHRHAALADEFVRELYANATSGLVPSNVPILLGAVGSYGRQLLGMSSDLDLCFITTAEPEEVARVVEAIVYPLWDAKVSLGHQVVHLDNIASDADTELALATELIDFRPLAGYSSLLPEMQARLSESIFSDERVPGFIDQLEARTAARHQQFGDSVYLLEPDVKRGTGGLRDLDCALWAARARYGTGDLDLLGTHGVVTAADREGAKRALDFLWTVRNHLHRTAGRKADRLTFGEQETVAKAMGYRSADDPSLTAVQRTGQTVEAFMSDYYRNARVLAHTSLRILGHARRRRHPSAPPMEAAGEGLVTCEGRLGLAQPERLNEDPVLALRVYNEAVARDVPLLGRTRDAIATIAVDPDVCTRLRASEEAGHLFRKLACTCTTAPFRSGSILGELHDVGLLLAIIPEFAPVVGRVHHDLYHVYTVDVHSIAAVDRLRALTRGELVDQLPMAARLATQVMRPQVLFLATLLHDVGKAIGGHEHARRGAQMAKTILARLGVPRDDIDDTCHLIEHHLTMYTMAVRRDVSDPATVTEFVRDMRGREGLRELYLLTVADLSTTSAVAMTQWKRIMLDGLFRASDAYLSGEATAPRSRVDLVQRQARDLWSNAAKADAFDEYLATMPPRYFLANQPAEIVAHAELAINTRGQPVGLSLVPRRQEEETDGELVGLCVVTATRTGAELRLVAGDRPGLLASIAAAIAANRFKIRTAQVNSRALSNGEHQAVDLFWVHPDAQHQPIEDRLARLQRDLSAIIDGKVLPGSLVRSRPPPSWSVRPTPPVFTEVVFDHDGSRSHTIIEVRTEDRPALLFTLASTLHNLDVSIVTAKISTEGKRAVDVFYATETNGEKIGPGERSEEIRSALASALAKAQASDEAAE
ncbi:MAG: [protein-PII] uridylyltransferase [Myxococcales bacterium]|nr:[protein-PII] uridylyltransferase [Myxococcales bacterium]